MSGLMERVYEASPIWAQQAMVSVYGAWWYARRYGVRYRRILADFQPHAGWSKEQYAAYQEQRLESVIEAAWKSPYYQAVFHNAGVTESMPPLQALRRMPVLTKQTLRERARDLLTRQPAPRGTVVFRSSGTTGTPTDIYYTREFHALETAVSEALNLHWAGVSHHERRVMFGVRKVCNISQDKPPFWRFSPVENMAYASIYHLSPKHLPAYIRFLRKFQPAIIMGYPSALLPIAKYALENDDIPAPAKVVVTSAETLTASTRAMLEAAWECKVFDRYGAVEGCIFASQCEHGNYHVAPEIGIMEIVDDQGQPCPPGVMGEVLCTGLWNTLQPLIRYKIGDVARWSVNQACPCGRITPLIDGIEGRFEDMCYTPDGRQVLRFDTVFKGVDSIREGQIIQQDLESYTIYVVPSVGFDQGSIDTLKENMHKHVGGGVRVNVETVESITRTSSGKFRAVVCNLSKEEKDRLGRMRTP